MNSRNKKPLRRRQFLARMVRAGTTAGLALGTCVSRGAAKAPMLEAGEGVADITLPLGTDLASFPRPLDRGRLVTGIRHPAAARALVLKVADTVAAIVSLDLVAAPKATTAGYLLASKDTLFVPLGRVSPAAFDRKDGRLKYQASFGHQIGGTYALLADDYVFTGTEQLAAYPQGSPGRFA